VSDTLRRIIRSLRAALASLQARVLDDPASTLIAIGLVTAGMGSGLSWLELRTDGASIQPVHASLVEQTRADREAFRDPEQIIVLLAPAPQSPSLASPQGLRHLRKLHASLAALPGIEADRVRSLATLIDPRPDSPLGSSGDLLDEIPDGPDRFADLLERIHASEIAGGLFLSPDARLAALYAPVAPTWDRGDVVASIERWMDVNRDPDFVLSITGPVFAEVTLGRAVVQDLARLIPLMVGVIAILLFLTFRTVGGVAVPMIEVIVVLIWTLGGMGWAGVPVTLVTTILPVLLMTMAVTDEIHLIERVQHHLAQDPHPVEGRPHQRLRRAVENALRELRRPIAITSITTAIGFLSFLSASITPIQQLGLFSAIGIMAAMVLSFTLIPALIVLSPIRWFEPRGGQESTTPAYETLLLRYPRTSLVVGCLVILGSAPGLLRLSVQDSWVDNFSPASPLVTAERAFNAAFWGSYRFDIVLTSERERFFRKREGLRVVEELVRSARSGPGVGGVVSHLIPYETIARYLGEEGPVSESTQPALLRLNALVFLIQTRIDLNQYLSRDGRSARVRVHVRGATYRHGVELEEYLQRAAAPLLRESGLTYHFSGELPVATETVRSIVGNQVRSIGWTVAGVGLVILLLYGSLRTTAVLMLPVAAAIGILCGSMGYGGMSFGIATSMFAALTVCVGVDFAVYFFHQHRVAGSEDRGPEGARVARAGRSIRWTVIVLSLGFSVLMLSDLGPNRRLGLLLASSMVTCYATTLIFLPRFMR
jgi:predicted RND superfamily exporter protein